MQDPSKSLGALIHPCIALTEATDLKTLLTLKLKSLRSKSIYIHSLNMF